MHTLLAKDCITGSAQTASEHRGKKLVHTCRSRQRKGWCSSGIREDQARPTAEQEKQEQKESSRLLYVLSLPSPFLRRHHGPRLRPSFHSSKLQSSQRWYHRSWLTRSAISWLPCYVLVCCSATWDIVEVCSWVPANSIVSVVVNPKVTLPLVHPEGVSLFRRLARWPDCLSPHAHVLERLFCYFDFISSVRRRGFWMRGSQRRCVANSQDRQGTIV